MRLPFSAPPERPTGIGRRWRLTLLWGLLFLAGLTPICLLSVITYYVTSQSVRDLVRANNESAAQMATELVRRDLEESMSAARALGMQPGIVEAVQRRDVEAAQRSLRAAVEAQPRIDRAFLIDLERTVWAIHPPAPKLLNYRDGILREYLKKLMASGEPTLSSVHRAGSVPVPALVINAAAPVLGPDRKIIGIVVFHHRLDEMSRWVKQIKVDNGGHVFVIDHLGTVAAHPALDVQNTRCPDYRDLEPVKAGLLGEGCTREYEDPTTNEMMVATFSPISVGGWPWVIVAQQPRDAAYAPIRRLGWELCGAAGAVAILALVAVLVLGWIGHRLEVTNGRLAAEVAQHEQAKAEIQKKQEALQQLLEVYERHRQLVAFEIHDGVAQSLAGAVMSFEALQPRPAPGTPPTNGAYAEALHMLRESLAEARRLMNGLRPTLLDDFGVVAAVDQLVRESRVTGGAVEIEWLHEVNFARLAAPLETTLYRIVQEALNNALRYSKSPKVRIALTQQGQRILVEVEDWGCGFDPQRVDPQRFGMRGIQERARVFDGQASVQSAPGRGTRVTVELPVIEATDE